MENRKNRWIDVVFLLGLLASITMVFALPIFPTGDGPLHTYYGNVLWRLATDPGIYGRFYLIRHLIQPYCLHYFVLISLGKLLSTAMAEKIFVAVIFANLALGFRFLAGKLGPSGPLVSIFMLPLLFSWSLAEGLLNCCFATGVMLWALGFWNKLPGPASERRAGPPLAGFSIALVLLVLSHPVPLMVLIGVIVGDLLLTFLHRPGSTLGALRARVTAAVLACAAFVVPMLLADRNKVASVLKDSHPHPDLLKELIQGKYLGFFAGHDVMAWISRVGLLLLVPAAIAVAAPGLTARWRAHELRPADRLLVMSVLFLLSTLSYPHSINGSYYFPQRMWDIAWMLILATAASASFSVALRRRLVVVGSGLALVTLLVAWPILHQAAEVQQRLATMPLPRDQRGLFVEPDTSINQDRGITTTPLFRWAAARSFLSDDDVLLNSPWIDQSTMPVKSRDTGQLLMDRLPNKYGEHPFDVDEALKGDAPAREQMLRDADFLVYTDPRNPHADLSARLGPLLHGHAGEWSCTANDLYALCRKQRTCAPEAMGSGKVGGDNARASVSSEAARD